MERQRLGATINMQTSTFKPDAYGEYKTAFGSFNTFKNTVLAGTGLINGKFTFDARLSKVSSDGYIDRASADLKSFLFHRDIILKNSFKSVSFSGYENTYHAWNGVPSNC
ncbi:MAG: hypothetical protein IPF54_23060 [Draconibacterium sp.]|nr:hypothetical protein [Draconibacterium sp.]